MHEQPQLSETRVNSVSQNPIPLQGFGESPDLFCQCHGNDTHWTSARDRQSATDNPIKIAVCLNGKTQERILCFPLLHVEYTVTQG